MSINNCMNFDYIIASGDSFTEGSKTTLGIHQSQTWPGLLGKELNIPWANLAKGGASNFDIAIQPVQKIHEWCTQNPGEKPLLIFGFTIDDRIPYFDYEEGMVKSFYTILPELIEETVVSPTLKERLLIDMKSGSDTDECFNQKINIEKIDNKSKDPDLDGFMMQTYNAIKIANNYANIFKGATVLWGFIHAYNATGDVTLRHCVRTNTKYKIKWPHWDTCFNRFIDNKPLQSLSFDSTHWVSSEDCHPNQKGIEVYKNFFKDIITQEYDK